MEADTGSQRKKIAFVIAADVTGGHEFQARALVDDFGRFADVTVHLNSEDQRRLFTGANARVEVQTNLFLEPGWIGKQVVNGLARMRRIRGLMRNYDCVMVCAGAVEAGICTSVALIHRNNVVLYLPFFYDRTVLWGPLGCVYNLILGSFGFLYQRVITINRIQARLVKAFLHRGTTVIPNHVADLPRATKRPSGRMLYIGRLDRQKRVPEMLQWLDYVDNPYSEILVIGDGPEHDVVEDVAASLKHIKASLVGWKSVSEQNELIGSQDVLVLNSLIEGEPLVIREAHKRGILVIARDIAGVRGCVPRQNRFNSEDSLRAALKAASTGALRRKAEMGADRTMDERLCTVRDLLFQKQ